jgi:hypothetical protein
MPNASQITGSSEEKSSKPSLYRIARLLNSAGKYRLDEQHKKALQEILNEQLEAFRPTCEGDPVQERELWLALKIRQLVTAGSDLANILPLYWELFDLKKSPEIAANFVEFAFLNADSAALVPVLQRLVFSNVSFYGILRPEIRVRLLPLLLEQADDLMLKLFSQIPDHSSCHPLEKLSYLALTTTAQNAEGSYQYYKKHQNQIDAALMNAKKFNFIYTDSLLYRIAIAALGFFDSQIARHCLEKIDKDSEYFQKADNLLKSLNAENAANALPNSIARITELADWRRKLVALQHFFSGLTADPSSCSLIELVQINDLLYDPLALFPQNPVVLNEIAGVILAAAHLQAKIPNLLSIFCKRRTDFDVSKLEIALWSPLAALKTEHKSLLYLKGIALLHLALSKETLDDNLLCEGARLVRRFHDPDCFIRNLDFSAIKNALTQQINTCDHLGRFRNPEFATRLMIVAGYLNIDSDALRPLLSSELAAHGLVLQLARMAQSKHEFAFARQICVANPCTMALTNGQLAAIWRFASDSSNFDLAWRTASVACARKALNPKIQPVWAVMGEKNLDLDGPAILEVNDALQCLDFVSNGDKQVLTRFLQLRPLIYNYLLFTAKAENRFTPKGSPLGSKVDSILNKMEWLAAPTNDACAPQNRSGHQGGTGICAVLMPVPGKLFSHLFAEIVRRLGFELFEWDGVLLHARLKMLLGGSQLTDVRKQLDIEKRKEIQSFYHLLDHHRRAESFGRIAMCFASRLAMMLHHNHLQALTEVRHMNLPLWAIRQLETFIVSDNYGDFRRKRHKLIANMVPVICRTEPLLAQSLQHDVTQQKL